MMNLLRVFPTLVFCLCFTSRPIFALTETLQEGYSLTRVEASVGGGFDFLPNGDLIGLSTSKDFTRLHLILVDANGDGDPAAPETLVAFPEGILFGSFVKVSPAGDRLILAESSTFKIFSFDLDRMILEERLTLNGIFDGVFLDNENMYLSSGSFNGEADVWHWNLSSPEAPQRIVTVTTGDAAAGAVATDDVGTLYYVTTVNTFPPPPNRHILYRFTPDQVRSVLAGGQVIEISTEGSVGELLARLDTGFNIQVNAFGNVFVSQTGARGEPLGIVRVTPDDAAQPLKPFLQFGNAGFAFTSVLAFENKHSFFDPFDPSPSRLALLFDDLANPVVYLATPARSDAFADTVIGSELEAPFDNSNLVLGPPIGGGTVKPDHSSVVTLPDGSGFISVSFEGGIDDENQGRAGLDLLGFGNPFFILDHPQNRFTEPGFFEVSADLNHNGIPDDGWFLILPDPLPQDLVPPYGDQALRGYLDYTPTLLLGDLDVDNVVDNSNIDPGDFYTVPDRLSFAGNTDSFKVDSGSGGGDAQDLRNAVFQARPGVPLRDTERRVRRVYLDSVDWVRVRDAKNGDNCVGLCKAEVDAISDAKNQIHGDVLMVDSASDLQPTIDGAQEGDIVKLLPGSYDLAESVHLKPGVSLVGSYGLWTINFDGDDVVLKGQNLAPGTACIALRGNAPALEQEYAVSGIHFQGCSVGISIDRLPVTVDGNFFTDTETAVKITADLETIAIRKNVLGHKSGTNPLVKGIDVNGGNVAFVQNHILNYPTGISYASEANLYVRNNIFSAHQLALKEEGTTSRLSAHFNVFSDVASTSFGAGTLEDNLELDGVSIFAEPLAGDYRLLKASPARNAGLGGSDPGAYDGPQFIPHDIALILDLDPPAPPMGLAGAFDQDARSAILGWNRNTETDLLGYYVYRAKFDPASGPASFEKLNDTVLTTPAFVDRTRDANTNYVYYVTARDTRHNESTASNVVTIGRGRIFVLDLTIALRPNDGPAYLSGAFVAQMTLDHMGVHEAIGTLHAYALEHNLAVNQDSSSIDPTGLRSALNHFALPGYNFSTLARTDQDQVLRDMAFWISRDIQNVPVEHMPGAVPAFGNYDHWLLVKGVASSANPHESSEYEVFGFWFTDPNIPGIGANTFKTAEALKQTYLLPVTNADGYQGKYVSVLEPPVNAHTVQRIKRFPSRFMFAPAAATSVSAAMAARSDTTVPSSLIVPVQNAAQKALEEDYLLYDEALAARSSELSAGLPFLVDGSDEDYYLVPFYHGRNVSAVMVLESERYRFREISVSSVPQAPRFFLLPIRAALRRIQKEFPVVELLYRRTAPDVKLVHEKGGNRYKPSWEISYGNVVFSVSQEGEVELIEGPRHLSRLNRWLRDWSRKPPLRWRWMFRR